VTPPAGPPFLGAERVAGLVPVSLAVDALEAALAGVLPQAPPRSAVPAPGGDLLLMPAAGERYAGVKVVSVAPGNAAAGLPRIQGVYVLFDATTLTPLALLDGVALTSLRTPALSAVAVRHLAPGADGGPVRLVVLGTGPQAYGHVAAVAAVRRVGHVTVAGRDAARAEGLAAWCRTAGVGPVDIVIGPAPSPALAGPVRAADVVVCATTARTPLLEAAWVREDALVVAVGSHEPDAREVPGELAGRRGVVVESRASALREAGDVVLAVGEGLLAPEAVVELADVVRGAGAAGARPADGAPLPRVFKSVGEAWEDLVVAALAYERLQEEP
jgi:ornithine cyclodeaminase